MTREYLEILPMFDETEEMEWLRDMNQLIRIRYQAKGWRSYTDDLEPLFQNDLLGRILAAVNGNTWLERRLAIPCATSRGWRDKHPNVPGVAPLGQSEKGNKQEAQRRGLPADSGSPVSRFGMRNREATAPDILSVLRDLWAGMGREEPYRQMSMQTVRRMPSRWG
jgi:hypothetical protein